MFSPELIKSEDERIKGAIIEHLRDNYLTEWALWLEKQDQKDSCEDCKHPMLNCHNFPCSKKQKYQGKSALEAIHEQRTDNANKVERKFKVGDVMRTLQEAADNITSGLPVVVSIDDEYYHCTNELIAIKDQDDYEFPSMNRKQKPTDTYCKENCKGYQETGKCYADGSCDAKIKAEQKPALSKEDNTKLRQIEYACMKFFGGDCSHINWLRKFTKPQTTWKPTEEQIQALNEAVGIVGMFTPRGSYLKSLSEQLKRL